MIRNTLTTKKILIGPALGAILGAGILIGCTGDSEGREGAEANHVEAGRGVERGEGSGGEHGSGGESGRESGGGGEEGSGAMLAPDQTFDMVRGGARLVLGYDPASNAFTGTVENTTSNVLTQVRIEVHLDNGTELGPTVPIDMAPGQMTAVYLPSTQALFSGWVAHAEVGGGEHGSGGEGGGEGSGEHGSGSEGGGEGSGEHGSGGGGGEGSGEHGSGSEGGGEGSGESGGEGSGEGSEASEAAMSSPIIPLDETWNGTLGGLAVSARYDAVTQSVQSAVRNTTSDVLCYVQAEPHLKSGTTTVGELGPDVLGDLNPGQEATTSVSVATEPALAGVSFDGYVVHMEVFDCSGPGPVPHSSEGGEGAGGESHGPGGEGSGSEGSGRERSESGGEEGSGANALALGETFDMVRGGARLILNYDAASNAFVGTVENTTSNVLTRVRIEIHLSNGTELGPTTPVDMAPGQVMGVNIPATAAPFSGWTPHAEVGSGEDGESGGGESTGEHRGSGGESAGEHGGSGGESAGESAGEHGSSGEGRGGG